VRRRLVAGVAALVLAGCGADGVADPDAGASASPTVVPTTVALRESFTLVATGDVLIHQDRSLTAGARQPDGSYDFSGVLAAVAPLIGAADLAICHLETPVAPEGGPYRGYPSFAVQPEIVDALAGAGYDECSTASNHSLDDGTDGLARTLDMLDAAGIGHAGSYRTQAESVAPQILDVDGVKVGHVAATFGLNGVPIPAGREWSVDVADVPDVGGMLAAAARARAAGAEVVVASLHCCLEYDSHPTGAQVAAVRILLASPDIDLVLGHHAHVVQPFERIDGEWAAYGLGNHIAQHATRGYPTEDSVLARFTFTRGDDGRFTVTRAEAVPLRIELGVTAVRVVPADPATFERVAGVLDRRGAVAAGLQVVAG
jgi:poly-gamma-glutamate capsule biosynthesis protein CapA/YwtB (metallophosphatase superfamily)